MNDQEMVVHATSSTTGMGAVTEFIPIRYS
jgi:hypothetical protein